MEAPHRVSEEAFLEGKEIAETETLIFGHDSGIITRKPSLAKPRKSHRIHHILNSILTAILLCSIAFVGLRDATRSRKDTADVEHYHYYCM